MIPESIIRRPPSAELRPNQTDQDTLPPYEVLDGILEAYVEEDRPLADIVALGFDEATVRQVITMVDRNEYKRRQAPPGVKITPRAFGRDWRLPDLESSSATRRSSPSGRRHADRKVTACACKFGLTRVDSPLRRPTINQAHIHQLIRLVT